MSIFTSADVASFRSDRLVQMLKTYAPSYSPSDAFFLTKLQSAEAETSRKLRVKLQATQVFPHTPSSDEITAIPNDPNLTGTPKMPWIEEAANDYDPEFFRGERWGYIITRQTPVISVDSISFVYPNVNQSFYTIPADWIRLDKRVGHIRLVPASAAFTAPLNAFLMQAMGGGTVIPNMIQVKYVCGLQNARADWPDLIDVIYKTAALSVLEDGFVPSSGSISGDGLAQSISLKMQDYQDRIDSKLFGPKGSNGGLWTAIHGIVSGILGITA